MQRLALLSIPLVLLSTPAVSADLDEPRDRAPPPAVHRERVIERYYAPPPVYVERRIYVEEPDVYYEPRPYAYYRPYRYAYAAWRPPHFFPRAHHWHRFHHRHW